MSIHEFMADNEGIVDDPTIKLSKPTTKRRIKNQKSQKKKVAELKEESDLTDITVPIGREKDWGDREYKLRLIDLTEIRRNELITQMHYRLVEGKGKAYYMIGISDDGFPIGISPENMDESIANLESMSSEIGAKIIVLRKDKTTAGTLVAEIMIIKRERHEVIMDIRVILLGAEGSGKSTLIGVLSSGKRDNGKGQIRNEVCRHKCELINRKTMSVSQHFLGFNSRGDVTNYSLGFRQTSEKILDSSSKILTFIDIAGCEKYAKSLMKGICSQMPEYALLVVDAIRGIQDVSREHLQLAKALKLRLIVIITKIDKAKEIELNATLEQLSDEIKGVILLDVEDQEDVVTISNWFLSEKVVPVFKISNVGLDNVERLKNFLNLLPVSDSWDRKTQKQFFIEQIIEKPDVKGKIVGGAMLKGTVNTGQKMLLGPDAAGKFCQVSIMNIHCKHVSVRNVKAGQFCSFLLSECPVLRPGMVLLDLNSKPRAAMEFECEITTIDKVEVKRIIKNNYQPLIHTQTIRQCTRVISEGNELELVPQQKTVLKLRFLYRPEYIEQETQLMIRDTFMTAFGKIIRVFYMDEAEASLL